MQMMLKSFFAQQQQTHKYLFKQKNLRFLFHLNEDSLAATVSRFGLIRKISEWEACLFFNSFGIDKCRCIRLYLLESYMYIRVGLIKT